MYNDLFYKCKRFYHEITTHYRGILPRITVVSYPVLFFTVEPAVVYYSNYSPFHWVATPPPCSQKNDLQAVLNW